MDEAQKRHLLKIVEELERLGREFSQSLTLTPQQKLDAETGGMQAGLAAKRQAGQAEASILSASDE